jgi:hypothetical protein
MPGAAQASRRGSQRSGTWGPALVGDQAGMTEPDGVPQVHVVVATDELQHRLRDHGTPTSAVPVVLPINQLR